MIRNSYEKNSNSADITIFIDVFRASTTLCYILAQEVNEVLGLADFKQVEEYITRGYRIVSEICPGGYNNSPGVISSCDLKGAKIIQKTGNLTEAIFNNLNFKRAISCAFVNIDAVAKFLLYNKFENIEIIASSHFEENMPAIEDISCAEALQMLLNGKKVSSWPNIDLINKKIESRKEWASHFPPHYFNDLALSLKRNTVPLIPEIVRVSDSIVRFKRITLL